MIDRVQRGFASVSEVLTSGLEILPSQTDLTQQEPTEPKNEDLEKD
jgi:hypothetical protein